MKRNKNTKGYFKAIAAMMIMVLAMNASGFKTQAKENVTEEVVNNNELVNGGTDYSYSVQPYTTMSNCEIVLAFTVNGLEMTFSTSSLKESSVIGVKDIKVQQKMWYGWKTVFTSSGAENHNEYVFMGSVTYPDAVNGKTYRVTCVHYANYDVYEEVENDTGSFKFII